MTLKEAIEQLRASGVDAPEYDARELFKTFGGVTGLITQSTVSYSEALTRAIERRAAREPLQYIIGTVGFYREEYKVTPSCLIPRSDTEILVDYAVKNIPEGECFADLCCGSGCIGISTLKNTRSTTCHSYDISDGALALTSDNAKANGVSERITVIKRDLISEEIDGEYFAILSNPPYIPKEVYEGLDKEIFHEPKMAFVGGSDGGDFYRRLTPIYRDKIANDGFIAYEIGYDQAEMLRQIADECSMSCEILKDLGGNDRVAVLKNTVTK